MKWLIHLNLKMFSHPHIPSKQRLERISQLDHIGKYKIEENWRSLFWSMLVAERLYFLKATLL